RIRSGVAPPAPPRPRRATRRERGVAAGARAERTAFETSRPNILPAVLARHKTLARVGRAIRARARQAQPTVARALGSALAALGLALGAGCTPSSRPLTIVVRCAPFPSVEAAAAAESLVQWTDADPTDDGAYALLERLGVRFYGPADSESVLPRARVALPAKLDVASAPAFELRGFWAWEPRGNPAFFRWMARRRMNLWTAVEPGVPLLRKLGFRLAGGGPSLQAD